MTKRRPRVPSILVRPGGVAISCALAIVVIAQADYVTGYEFTLALIYLLPIYAATWMSGRGLGWAMVLLSTVAWFFTDVFAGHGYSHPFWRYWEALIKLATFGIFVEMLVRLKRALARADERFATALEGIEASVCLADNDDGMLLLANGRFRHDFGLRPGAGDVRALLSLLGLPSLDAHSPLPLDLEGEHAGRVYLVRERSIPLIDGRPVRLLTLTDITEHKRAEQASRQQQEQMQRTAKLVAVGEMASMLAHEMNQPLSAIVNFNRGCIRRLRAGDADPEELLDIMQQTSAQAERAAGIIQRARDFVRKREPSRELVDMHAVVARAVRLVHDDLQRSGVDIRVEPRGALPPVPADRRMIEQVVVNLVMNAIDAMERVPAGERRLLICLEAGEGGLRVEVRDSGCGIPPEISGDLFKPFFSTKPDGMGLGLSICRSIVEFHHGQLSARANPGAGSAVQFTLPLQEPS